MRFSELGSYQIDSRIGDGGMGVVYKATDTRLGRPVAVKLLQSRFLGDEDARDRFLQEARAASAIDHPNICTIYQVDDTEDGDLFLVMAFYEGETVAEKIRRGPLPVDEAVSCARQLLTGLSRAHEAGIVHRDVKPGNLIVTPHGELKILDFGLAKLLGQRQRQASRVVQGTAAYMAPEQTQGDPVDHRVDLWSAGVVLYEMLAGRHAFNGSNPREVLQAVAREEPEPLSLLRPELPARLESVVDRALEKEPSRRYQTAREMLAALDDAPSTLDGPWEATVSGTFGGTRDSGYVTSPPTTALPRPGRPARTRSVLVLPFVSVSPGSDLDYFLDGLTEEVITDLSGVEALRVISRTSAMQLKGTEKSLPALSSELRVQYVLEGSVRIRGDQLRITARLVDAPRDVNVWAERFTGTLEDVFEIQESLARRIVDALKVRLTPGEEERLGQRLIRDPQAYEHYLRAKQEILLYTEEALDRALRYLEEAQKLVGENVLLLSARGHAYWQYVNGGISADPSLVEEARRCGEKILTLDSDSSHGHRLLGLVQITEGDPQGAVRSLKRSLAKDPNDSDTLAWLLACYALVGRPSAGAPVAERLLRIDPLTPIYQCLPGVLHMMAGDLEAAFEPFERASRMDPANPIVRLFHGQLLAFADRREEAVVAFDRLAEDTPETLFGQLAAFYAGALDGREGAADALGEEARKAAAGDPEYAWMVAECFCLAGDKRRALEWLETAEERGFINYPVLAEHDPLLADLRHDGRFREILDRVEERWQVFEA